MLKKITMNYESVDEIMLLQASGNLQAFLFSCDNTAQHGPWPPLS